MWWSKATGRSGELFKLYESEERAIQEGHWGKPVGFHFTDIGNLNRIVQLWAYRDYEDRVQRRDALLGDPAWKAYLAKVLPLFVKMENMTLRPAPFWR